MNLVKPVMHHLSGEQWVGEASASLSEGRLKSPLPRLSEGLVKPFYFGNEDIYEVSEKWI